MKIRYRAISKHDRKWVYGHYYENSLGMHNIVVDGKLTVEVISETVGIMFGDYADGDIYEYEGHQLNLVFVGGSLCLCRIDEETDMYELFDDCWNDTVYPLAQKYGTGDYDDFYFYDLDFVGTIHDELIRMDEA